MAPNVTCLFKIYLNLTIAESFHTKNSTAILQIQLLKVEDLVIWKLSANLHVQLLKSEDLVIRKLSANAGFPAILKFAIAIAGFYCILYFEPAATSDCPIRRPN